EVIVALDDARPSPTVGRCASMTYAALAAAIANELRAAACPTQEMRPTPGPLRPWAALASTKRKVPPLFGDEDRPRTGPGVGEVTVLEPRDDRLCPLGNGHREALGPRLGRLDARVLAFPGRLQHQVGDGDQLLSRRILKRSVVDPFPPVQELAGGALHSDGEDEGAVRKASRRGVADAAAGDEDLHVGGAARPRHRLDLEIEAHAQLRRVA